jgi:phage terminase small subunit
MPALANPRHERFVRFYLKTHNASEAYRRAGYATTTNLANRVNASRLLSHANVKRRFAELRRSMAQKTEISLASLLQDLAEDRALARRLGQASAAVQATQLAAKLTGHLVDRKETGAPGEFAGLKTAEDVLEELKKLLGAAAAAAIEASLMPALAAPDANGALTPHLDGDPESENSLN